MLDFSFGELLLIGLVALLIVGPKDMPVVLCAIGRWVGQFKGFADELRVGFKSAMEETSLEDFRHDIHTLDKDVQFIRDEQGNLQRVYDISDFMDEHERNTKVTSPAQEKNQHG